MSHHSRRRSYHSCRRSNRSRRRAALLAVAALLLLNLHAVAQRRGKTARVVATNNGKASNSDGAMSNAGVMNNGGARARPLKLTPHRVALSGGRTFNLNLPEGYGVSVAAQGLRRARFMAESPEGRIFVTDMYNLTDNRKGAVYVLEEFDPTVRSFKKVTAYLTHLRNPNSVAFYTDRDGNVWLYLALTDRLLRYRYEAWSVAPTGEPEVLATFPDYGLNYKYGGWHLTRTVLVGGNGKIYVSVGSSCNACVETEDVRAAVLEMDADGGNRRLFARGLRNAVGMRWVKGRLFATDMGADHLGDEKPADTMYAVRDGANYGWPYCYQSGPKVYPDAKFNAREKSLACRNVPAAYAAFDAHSAPLGLEYFDGESAAELSDSFLVALHGSTKRSLERGYRLVRVRGDGDAPAASEDFITGFLRAGRVYGRPADVFRFGRNAFLLTDDHAGVVYYVYRR